MRLLHYIEIENFKRFGARQRIELDHPAVLIGPNNCGKTSAIQALALWSQAVRTWYDVRKASSAKERTATSLNRLNIVSVPVTRTRFFWHNTQVRKGSKDIALVITVGVEFEGKLQPLVMRFRNQGDELVYCTPDGAVIGNLPLLAHAASLRVELLYPMSGLDTEEPILQPGRVDVLLGQGRDPPLEGRSVIDLRGRTGFLAMLALVRTRCAALVAPDGGILNAVYFLDAGFPVTVVSLWSDPRQGLLKARARSPNPELVHVPLVGEGDDVRRIAPADVLAALEIALAPGSARP